MSSLTCSNSVTKTVVLDSFSHHYLTLLFQDPDKRTLKYMILWTIPVGSYKSMEKLL